MDKKTTHSAARRSQVQLGNEKKAFFSHEEHEDFQRLGFFILKLFVTLCLRGELSLFFAPSCLGGEFFRLSIPLLRRGAR